MRKIFLIVLMLTVFLIPMAMAASHYDETVNVKWEDEQTVVFGGSVIFTGDGTGTFYTQAMNITDCRSNWALAVAWTNAESGDDVNMYVEYSMDRETWIDGLVSSGQIFDDLNGGTVQADTMDTTIGDVDELAKCAIWMRLVFIGQSGNPVTTETDWYAIYTKTEKGSPRRKSERIRNRIE